MHSPENPRKIRKTYFSFVVIASLALVILGGIVRLVWLDWNMICSDNIKRPLIETYEVSNLFCQSTKTKKTVAPIRLHEYFRVEDKMDPSLCSTYYRLRGFTATGDLSQVANVDIPEIRALAYYLANTADRASILELLDTCSNIQADLVPEDPQELADYLVNGFRAIRGDHTSEVTVTEASIRAIASVAFSGSTDQVGRIYATADRFQSGVQTIYGVFENNDWQPNIGRVFAVWRNTTMDKVVYQKTESILAKADSNYVWLEADEGWPPGHWQLDLFDPAHDFSLLATGTFDIE
jgi:hypothetical protein